MKKITFEGSTELEILKAITAELKCSIADGTKYASDILIVRRYCHAALVIYIDLKEMIENNVTIFYFKSKITEYNYVGLNLFIYLFINELRLKTNSYTTLPEITKKYYQLGEIEKNAKDLKV
ncbi:hypothetical protein [Daejeonella sp.]|uniref:hypothetical protein n=1 Tax=Daejeonella sp. TaxID=2805397 RepID=UPI0027B8C9B8|nr:hypothetical protein [Daejeonella sp.]